MLISACAKNEFETDAVENPDDAVKITYMGKGFSTGTAFYGDQFQFEAPDDFYFDFVVLTEAAYKNNYGSPSALASQHTESLSNNLKFNNIAIEDYLLHGSCTESYQILPEGDYTVYVLEIGFNGKSSGVVYSKKFTVKDYIAFHIDGDLQLQSDWVAEYMGRYASQSATGDDIWCDRITTKGTGDALYYHVFAPAGAITSEQELKAIFEKGCDVDDLKGGQGLIEWYKLIAPQINFGYGLNWLLAKGYKDSERGFMDYTLKSTGTYDVYTVEMLLNGHISGRYGKTTLDITGSPNLADPAEVAKSGRQSRLATIGKMRL